MTQYLPPNLLALFQAREPIPYLPPTDKLTEEKPECKYGEVSKYVNFFESKSSSIANRGYLENKQERHDRRLRERSDRCKRELERKLDKWDPHSDPSATGDPFKTLFVARLSFEVTEAKLRREFEVYGPIKKVSLVTDAQGKLRGYGFIEYEHQRDMRDAYKHADGKKIYQKRVLVDVERGRTGEDWIPRRLGGGLGGTRRGPPDNCSKYSGREDEKQGYVGVEERKRRYSPLPSAPPSRERERNVRKYRSRSRSRSREKERRRLVCMFIIISPETTTKGDFRRNDSPFPRLRIHIEKSHRHISIAF